MPDNLHLIMEETGCDEGQAHLALTLCNFDVLKSISRIFDLLKDITVVKGKFYTYGNHLYGIFTITVDKKHQRHLSTKAVITYNPKIYETDLQQNWYEYEKKLYATRLSSGSISDLSLNIESKIVDEILDEYNESFFSAIKENNVIEVADILEDILREPLKTTAINFEILLEELNLTQFKKISDKNKSIPQQLEFEFNEYSVNFAEPLSLDVVPVSCNGASIRASILMPGDEIAVLINDDRDIAQYLSKLLGGISANGTVSLPVKIQEIYKSKDDLTIIARLATGVVGKSIVSEETPVTVISWTKRSGFFNRIVFRFYLIFSKMVEKIRRVKNE
ncbi:MAG: hypothetical protein AB1349_06785 [Elusimicrobiota bacterium]